MEEYLIDKSFAEIQEIDGRLIDDKKIKNNSEEQIIMCEFKVSDEINNSQLAEEIVIISYSEDKKLLLKDILGDSKELDSALIYDVNTLNQTCKILQHKLIKPFLKLLEKIIFEIQEKELTLWKKIKFNRNTCK